MVLQCVFETRKVSSSSQNKSTTSIAKAETYCDRTVERVLKTITPLSVFLRDAEIPGERSSQVRSFIIEAMHIRVVVWNSS